VAIADPLHLNTEAPTQETGTIAPVPGREPSRMPATSPQLAPGRYVGVHDAGQIVFLPLAGDVMHIGRSPAADIVLEDASVSRRHALIARRGDAMVILDDRSLNGIRVNGVRVKEATLQHGDEIVLGQVALRFVDVR
jgi:pSer/pThr/pTyr-binding forkhead associated (FHA) protein